MYLTKYQILEIENHIATVCEIADLSDSQCDEINELVDSMIEQRQDELRRERKPE